VVYKIGAEIADQVSFSIFSLFVTWDREVALNHPTFSNHGNVGC